MPPPNSCTALHEYGLLDAAQYGFVVDGSCIEPLTIMARLFERGRGEGGEELHVAFLGDAQEC